MSKQRILSLFIVAQQVATATLLATGQGHQGGHGGGGNDHGHQPSTYNPAPTWNSWDYNWPSTPPYNPPPIEPHPYRPGNQYRPLFTESTMQPEIQTYPETSLYLPTFTMSTDTPMVFVGDDIRVNVDVQTGSPPFTVFWHYDDETDWISGTTSFVQKADRRGVITIAAIVKDLNSQISLPQEIQVVVLRKSSE